MQSICTTVFQSRHDLGGASWWETGQLFLAEKHEK